MEEPVINQPTNMIGRSNLSGLEKLVDTKELTICLRKPSAMDCEYIQPKLWNQVRPFCGSEFWGFSLLKI